jgi:hypothetical protein
VVVPLEIDRDLLRLKRQQDPEGANYIPANRHLRGAGALPASVEREVASDIQIALKDIPDSSVGGGKGHKDSPDAYFL